MVFDRNRQECSSIAEQFTLAAIPYQRCEDTQQLCDCLDEGAAAALFAQDGVGAQSLDRLASVFRRHQENCGPSVLIVTHGAGVGDPRRFGSPLLIERPLRPATLISWARAALRTFRREHDALHRLKEQSQAARRVQDELAGRKAELRRANLDLEQFIHSASHELREPLRNLALYSQKLRRTSALPFDDETRASFDVVLSSAQRMETLFRDLLAFLQVSSATAADMEVDSNAILQDVLARFQGVIRATGAIVESDPLPPLSISSAHLTKLFEHLIENAIKYRAPGMQPRIHISARPSSPAESVICVHDNGLGIAPQHQEKVFGLFRRLHAGDQYEGTGLGLAVCQKITEQYDGRIWVESELGKGAVFCFALPRSVQNPQSVSVASA